MANYTFKSQNKWQPFPNAGWINIKSESRQEMIDAITMSHFNFIIIRVSKCFDKQDNILLFRLIKMEVNAKLAKFLIGSSKMNIFVMEWTSPDLQALTFSFSLQCLAFCIYCPNWAFMCLGNDDIECWWLVLQSCYLTASHKLTALNGSIFPKCVGKKTKTFAHLIL